MNFSGSPGSGFKGFTVVGVCRVWGVFFCFCRNGVGFVGRGGSGWFWGAEGRLGFCFAAMVWVLSGMVGGEWFWGAEGLGLRGWG